MQPSYFQLGCLPWLPALVAALAAGGAVATQAAEAKATMASVDADAVRDELLRGVEAIAVPQWTNHLAVYGPKAVGVIHDGHYDPMLAASTWGRGRLVLFGRRSWIALGVHAQIADTGTLYHNCIRWASRGAAGPRIVTNHVAAVDWLRRQGFQRAEREVNWEAHLEGADLVILEMPRKLSFVQQQRLAKFVTGGGGLLAGYGDGGETLDANRLFRPAGVGWAEGFRYLESPCRIARCTDRANAEAVFDLVAEGRAADGEALAETRAALLNMLEVLAPDDPLLTTFDDALAAHYRRLFPSPGRPVSKPMDHLLLHWEAEMVRAAPVERIEPHRTAEAVYGSIADDAPRVKRTVRLESSHRHDRDVWLSTGLYAAPGEVVHVTVPYSVLHADLLVRIGSHTGHVLRREHWMRMPTGISRTFPLEQRTTPAAGAYGGMIYIEVSEGEVPGKFEVTVEGALEAPWFLLGETGDREWVERARDLPAPYAELACGRLIFSLPSKLIRKLDQPTELMSYWETVVRAQDELAGVRRHYALRGNVDVQVGFGAAYAGYPIQAPIRWGAAAVDLQKLREHGSWGWFHELGHMHQSPFWTFDGTSEVTVNIFSMAAFDAVDARPDSRWRVMWEPVERAALAESFLAAGLDYSQSDKYDQKLVPFAQLSAAFGSRPFEEFFDQYLHRPPDDLPENNQEKIDQWLVRFSEITGRNLTPFFEAWRWPLSADARRDVEHLPEWTMIEQLQSTVELEVPADEDTVVEGLLATVYDMTGGPLEVRIDSPPSHGNLAPRGEGEFIYKPRPGYRGRDEFRYQISNPVGGRAQGTMQLHVVDAGPR